MREPVSCVRCCRIRWRSSLGREAIVFVEVEVEDIAVVVVVVVFGVCECVWTGWWDYRV